MTNVQRQRVWVVETRLGERWFKYAAVCERSQAFALLRTTRDAYPDEKFRIKPYVPENPFTGVT